MSTSWESHYSADSMRSIMRRLLTLAVMLVPAMVSAQQASRPAADEYTRRVQSGIGLLVGGDRAGAIEAFVEASMLEASRPEAHYFIGEAKRAAGDLEAALAAFTTAAERAQSANVPLWRARALHGIASTLERMDGRIEQARTAWQAYATFADANRALADPQIGRTRIQAIDRMNEQERVYAQVRQRIAEREEERQREARETREPRRTR